MQDKNIYTKNLQQINGNFIKSNQKEKKRCNKQKITKPQELNLKYWLRKSGFSLNLANLLMFYELLI